MKKIKRKFILVQQNFLNKKLSLNEQAIFVTARDKNPENSLWIMDELDFTWDEYKGYDWKSKPRLVAQ